MKTLKMYHQPGLLAVIFVLMATIISCHKNHEQPAVKVTGFTPAQGKAGDAVTINGFNFSTTASANAVDFNGTAATVTSATATVLTVTVPQGATTGKVSVGVDKSKSTSTDDFVVLAPPGITSFSPASGAVGTTVTITGANFSATATENTVKFGSATATVTQASATSLTVTVPAGAASGKISVTVNGMTATSTNDFTVSTPAQALTISSFAPLGGPAGTTVTINGTNFSTTVASNIVKFNGTQATVSTATATSLTVTVPAGATTGKVSVTVGGITVTSTNDFTVSAAALTPTIISFAPLNGTVGTSVVITGTNFDPVVANNTVKFSPNVIATINNVSADGNSITVTVPAGAAIGKIIVTTLNGSVTSTDDFSVTPSLSGWRVKERWEGGLKVKSYQYNNSNQLTQVIGYATDSLNVTYQHDQTTYQYDNQGRLTYSETADISNLTFRTNILDVTYTASSVTKIFSKDIRNAQNVLVKTAYLTSVATVSGGMITTSTVTGPSGSSTLDYTYKTTAAGEPEIDIYYRNSNTTSSFIYYTEIDPDPENQIDPFNIFTAVFLLKRYTNGINANYSYNINYVTDSDGNIEDITTVYPNNPSLNYDVAYIYEQY
jgi:hypothetical protein